MTTVAKGMPPGELGAYPLSKIVKEAILAIKSEEDLDTGAASFVLFHLPANTFIEEIDLYITTAFTSGTILRLGSSDGGAQYGTVTAGLIQTGQLPIPVNLPVSAASILYGSYPAAPTDGLAQVVLKYRPNCNESPWTK